MHLHILGICGTFMGSLALLARQLGHRVTGSDQQVYPPMSTQLAEQGIELHEGYDSEFLQARPDLVVVGNAMSRGNPAVEALLDSDVAFVSGPEWLRREVLQGRWVLAVAGTHGKTTTSSMLAKILDEAGLQPGFLIGGIPQDFGVSARLGEGRYFVVEADEYDSAFFDKRSKFVHYHPRTLVLNNLEFDHADIFADLQAIQTQFHHLLRTVPASGRVVLPAADAALEEVLQRGCWTERRYFSVDATTDEQVNVDVELAAADGSEFQVMNRDTKETAAVCWPHNGLHNVNNAAAAMLAAEHLGVPLQQAAEALSDFVGVKRRMEKLAEIRGITVYDDFAHHPTAIATTLDGLHRQALPGRIVAVIEPRSNTMRLGTHTDALKSATDLADWVLWYHPDNLEWDPAALLAGGSGQTEVMNDIEKIVSVLVQGLKENDHVVIMSNGGFAGIHQKLIAGLERSGTGAHD